MPHPPLAVPEVGGGKENAIAETLQAMDEIAIEISRKKPQAIIFISPHSTAFGDYFHISPGTRAGGNFERFGVDDVEISAKYDTELVSEISRVALEMNVPAGVARPSEPSLDHGVMVPMYYINRRFSDYKAVRCSLSGMDAAAHFSMGKVLADAVKNLNRRTVVVASGDLSHKLAQDGPYGFAPEGEVFDREIMKFLSAADFPALLSMDAELREKAAECGYGAFAILGGCLDGADVSATKLSYECPFGVGYGVVRFEISDAYRALARRSLEHRVKTGQELPFSPDEIQPELLSQQAGAFVSLHIRGELRGCIGTIAPTKDCVAKEIMTNAVSSGLYDHRFSPVRADELPHLTYKVDILDEPEDISSADELDVKKYGVIVESGYKRGLLLPNLNGVDTVQMQIDIACQKAGISPNEKFNMQRFKVTRYE
jgi:AmmeMemoRadiSam system protein A/AmmeMemoRadiSam system protein B